eukprot:TRINITY_DN12919_c0_g1_i1.p1 TRINITY_DN12919_c0_g1~~TRINITY_DN12919_c0_g1_i1.p1  ORF type:complete len:436 (+),score=161.64 TRINITY_DN12919_c0_g1_i1:49-1356(+)
MLPVQRAAVRAAARQLRRKGDVRPGQHKSPVTDQLWQLRAALKGELEAEQKRADQGGAGGGAALAPQPILHTEVEYLFSEDASLAEKYINPWGDIRPGRLLEDLDALAGNIAFRHTAQSGQLDVLLVTASIDRVVLCDKADLADDVALAGRVTWVGSSSMEIRMTAGARAGGDPWLVAYFTFVARDKATKKARQLAPLALETSMDRQASEAGAARAAVRKAHRKEQQNASLNRQHVEELVRTTEGGGAEVTIEQTAAALLRAARPQLKMPCVAGAAVRMSDTRLTNTEFMQPQQKNTAGRIFGGFLVRRAYELAVSTCALFVGGVDGIRFREVDEVAFLRPVDVGDCVQFTAIVLFTSSSLLSAPSVHVEVVADVLDPAARTVHRSNAFNFTFTVPEGRVLPAVLPETMEDALTATTRYFKDVAQCLEDSRTSAA